MKSVKSCKQSLVVTAPGNPSYPFAKLSVTVQSLTEANMCQFLSTSYHDVLVSTENEHGLSQDTKLCP